jgi:hypothetical protein
MNGIQVVIFLVRCSEGLLLCEDLPSEHLRFSSIDICHASISSVIEETSVASDREVDVRAMAHFSHMPATVVRPVVLPIENPPPGGAGGVIATAATLV